MHDCPSRHVGDHTRDGGHRTCTLSSEWNMKGQTMPNLWHGGRILALICKEAPKNGMN
jgi:hypothetical protein